jgi:hypothetical protein
MSEELLYLPTSALVKGCCNGDIDVHLPLTLENRLGDKKTEMLFVDHLLNNSRKDQVPFIKLLSGLRGSIKGDMSKLIEDNSFVKHLLDSSIKEWRRDISPYEIFHSDIDDDDSIDEQELFDYSKLVNESNETTETKKKISELENALKQRMENSDNGVLGYSEDTDREIRDIYHRTTKCKNRIEGHTNHLKSIKEKLDPKHTQILMDLGMKNKSSYMQFFKDSDSSPVNFYLNDRNSIGIPKNIQTVFTNYTLINNMIHKELDYIEYKMNELKKVADENNTVMKEFVSGLDTHEHIHDMYEPDNPSDSEDDDEEETIKKYVIREDKGQDDESESLLSRLASYFTEDDNKLTDKDKQDIATIVDKKNIDKEINDKINSEPTLFADAGDDDY